MQKTAFTLLCLLGLCFPALAQEAIRGRIVSASDSLPLPGATVRLLGAAIGTVSNAAGHFELPLRQPVDTLEVSFLGYLPRTVVVRPPYPTALVIALRENTQDLREVVISTGYEQLSPERATGSYTVVDDKLLNRSVSTDVISRLKGVAPGLAFDERLPGRPKVNIRGISTIYANAEPLIILDNFPYEGNLNAINPNDVESITVLKDAAAASIWGARAGNGVIVITTKKGRYKQPLRVNLNSNVSMQSKPDFDNIAQMGSGDFIEVERFLFDKGFYNSQENHPSHPVLSPAVELLILHRDGQLTNEQLESRLQELASHDVRDDFRRYLYENSLKQQHALSLSGGSDKMTYYLSGGYDATAGQLKDAYNRLSLRSESSYTPWKNLSLNLGINYTQATQRGGRPSYEDITPDPASKVLYPYARLADENGMPLPLPRDYRRPFAGAAEANGLLNWDYVPLKDNDFVDNQTEQQQLILTAGAELQLAKGLALITRYQYAANTDENSNLQQLGSYYTRNLINRFTQQAEDGTLSFPVPRGSILDSRLTSFRSQNARGQLRYDGAWGKHEIAALGGAELQSQHTTGSNFRTYGYDENVITSIPVDYTGLYTAYYNPGARLRIPDGTGFTDRTRRFTSYYANSTYTYDGRYILSLSARKDASNLFGVATNQRGVPLWSTGIAWNAHRESFYHLPWMDRLKLKLSYGYNGNVDNSLTAQATIISLSGGNLNNTPFAVVRNYPNPSLRWEKIATWNAGLEFGLLGNRLGGTLEYYRKYGTDLIGDAPVDQTAGLLNGTVRRNVAAMKGHGLDLSLTGKLIDRAFDWSSTLLFSYNRSEVSDYAGDEMSGSRYINSGLSVVPLVGKPLYGIYSYAWRGLDPQTGDPQGVFDGELSKDYTEITRKTPLEDLVYHGPALPPYFGSLLQTFTYKGVSLSFNITYRFGYYFRRPSLHYNNLFNSWEGHSDYAQRWQQPGDEQHTNVPSLVYPNNVNRDNFYMNSEALVEKGDHVRLQDVNLSYDIIRPGKPTGTFRSLQVYALARDLGILWRANQHHLDPDLASGYLPQSPTFSLGLRAGL
ncbi:SusC/RagA family TonB-linked outer membrane protein [Pontibacter sp. MBLB2868]|uniref:SusC/RagA family TonB-linked outer membrane protein n=1 Tax=Pontibacter sp. MBLB2868 TaxID=3451555 RepID=UPI003F74EE66